MPEKLWADRKRYFGLPLSFTKYSLSENRLFCETGLLHLKEEEVLLYRIRDITLSRSLSQRIFGVGTVCVISSDKTASHLDIINVKNAREVKERIFAKVEEAKEKRRIRATELLGDSDFGDDDIEQDYDC